MIELLSEKYRKQIVLAEQYIREKDTEKASGILYELLNVYPTCGQAQFDLGNIFLVQKKYDQAMHLYRSALKNGYKVSALHHNCAGLYEREKNVEQAEKMLLQALECASDREHPFYMMTLFQFYIRNCKNMDAERLSYHYLKEYPGEYMGYHMLLVVRMQENDLDAFLPQLEALETQFDGLEDYWIDRLAALEKAGKYSAMVALLTQNQKIMEVIPELALQKKAHMMILKKNYDEALDCIIRLFKDYARKDAAFELMVYSYQNKNYLVAGELAQIILTSEKAKGNVLFYLTLYCYIFILYYGLDANLNEKVLTFMKKSMTLCVNWFKKNDLYTDEMGEAANILDEIISGS